MLNNRLYSLTVFLLFFCVSIGFSQDLPNSLEIKVKKHVENVIESKNLVYNQIEIDNHLTKKRKEDKLFSISANDSIQGYVYLGIAPSMKNVYNYMLVFDQNLNTINAKVLIYREKHGRQIGTKRWLSQFIGKNINDEIIWGENVDGISGATISSRSMTLAVSDTFKLLRKLREKNII